MTDSAPTPLVIKDKISPNFVGDTQVIDIHAHLQFEEYDLDRVDVLGRMNKAKVSCINVGTTVKTTEDAILLADRYSSDVNVPINMWTVAGIHPIYIPDEQNLEEGFENIVRLASNPGVVGIGETGIDVFRVPHEDVSRVYAAQVELFKKHIELSLALDKPLMLHARDSYQEILAVLDQYLNLSNTKLKANAHFFVGSIEEARAFLDRGLGVSFTGVITFASQYQDLVRFVPLSSMMVETDSPYVSPTPFRGTRNEPVRVLEVLKSISQIKNIPLEIVQKTILDRSVEFFGIRKKA